MKCKDCSVSRLIICPECGKEVVLCMEGNDLIERKYWDTEDEVRCDGIIG